MLRELLQREKWYAKVATAAAIGTFLLFLATLILGVALAPDALPALLCCCVVPVFFPPSLTVFLYLDRYNSSYSTDRLFDLLSRYGTVDRVIDEIDAEWGGQLIEGGSANRGPNTIVDPSSNHTIITENWLLHFRRGRLWIVRIDDVLWAYKRINVKWTYLRGEYLQFMVCVSVSKGRSMEIIVARQASADQMLEQIIHRHRAILVGYQMHLHDLAKEGIPALRVAVCERVKQLATLSQDDQSDWLEERLDEANRFVCRYDPQLHAHD